MFQKPATKLLEVFIAVHCLRFAFSIRNIVSFSGGFENAEVFIDRPILSFWAQKKISSGVLPSVAKIAYFGAIDSVMSVFSFKDGILAPLKKNLFFRPRSKMLKNPSLIEGGPAYFTVWSFEEFLFMNQA